jgi:hypothetical protein
MDINEMTQNSKLHRALLKSKQLKRPNHWNMQSGRFPQLERFTKLQNFLLESFYTVSDMHNPSAYRLYLYLLRKIIGFEKRSVIEYRPKKIKAELSMGNSFYKAERILKEKNMIRFEFKQDTKYIGLIPYPELWITDSKDRIDEIIDKEINELLGIQKDALSSSSSSWSSSSTSSTSYPSDDDYLMRELDELGKLKPNRTNRKPKQRYYPMFEPPTPDELKSLDELDNL